MTKFTCLSLGLGCLAVLSVSAAGCSSDGDAAVAPGDGGRAADAGAGGDGAADPGAGGSPSGGEATTRGGVSSTPSGGAVSAFGGAPAAGGEAQASSGIGGEAEASSGAAGTSDGPGTGGAAGAPPSGAGGASPECTGTHPNVEGDLRFCDPGDCYCTDPADTCFSGEVADACCNDTPDCGSGGAPSGAGGAGPECTGTHPNVEEELRFCDPGDCYCSDPFDTCFDAEEAVACCTGTSDCGSDEEPGGVDCTGEHPITEPSRTCEAGFCLCSNEDTIDVCLPADVATACCPPEIELDCVE